MPRASRKILSRILSPLFLILIWYLTAFFMKAPLILPYPHSVLVMLFQLVKTAAFWQSFSFTFLRVIYAFIFSSILGFFAGLLSADYTVFKAFLEFPLAIIRVTPVVAFILIALFWFKSGTVPVFAAVLMALPVMTSASEKGFEKTHEKQERLFKAACSGFTGFRAFRYIRLPDAGNSLLAGINSSFGICWKVVAAGEVLSIPRFAAGAMMQRAQIHLETTTVLAIAVALVITSLLCQLLLKTVLNKFSSKNQQKAL